MSLIHVPRPPKSAMNPDRPASGLLKWQVRHLHAAQRNLPHRFQTDIYVNAIKTEGEAAEYIRQVTEAVHQAHEVAARKRARAAVRHRRALAASAAAETPETRKTGPGKKKQSGKVKGGRKSQP